jgi:Tfp pilus assembly protein PilF
MIAVKRTSLFRCLIPLSIALACAGCSSPGDKHATGSVATAKKTTQRAKEASTSKAEQELQRGIKSYEEAEYEIAAKQFQSALDWGLVNRTDKANAYKYLAFVACTSGRGKSCHAEFRNALEVDPKFKLAPAEVGHPIWGPVFRSVKEKVGGKGKTP